MHQWNSEATRVGGTDAQTPQTRQPVPVFQLLIWVIRLLLLMYVRFPLSLCNVEDLLFEPGIAISHETGSPLEEQFRPDVRWRHSPPSGQSDEGLPPMEGGLFMMYVT